MYQKGSFHDKFNNFLMIAYFVVGCSAVAFGIVSCAH